MGKAVFFDVDGTLIDTTEYILQAFEYTLKEVNVSDKTRADVIPLVGLTLQEMYKVLAPEMTFEPLRVMHDDFQSKNIKLVKPFPNTKKTLQNLRAKNVFVAAITNRGFSVKDTLQAVGIFDEIDLVITKNDVLYEKPHPEPIFKAMSYFSLERDHVHMVGDTFVDIEAGKNAGVKTVGVTYGFGGHLIKESNPDYIIHDIEEVELLLN